VSRKEIPEGWLLCPSCGGETTREDEGGGVRCDACGNSYPFQNGVLRMASGGGGDDSAGVRTVRQFGASWEVHDHMAAYYENQFLDWIAPLQREGFRGKDVLEAGCGKGRHSRIVGSWGPRSLWSIDLSSAIDLAAQNSRTLPSVHCVQADLLNLPFPNGSFDLVFCVGVLHHLPDPQAGLRELWRTLKPGGTLCLWVYGREGNGWIVRLVDPVRRGLTSRLPTRVLRPLLWPLSGFLYLLLKILYAPARSRPRLARRLPYFSYLSYISAFPFREVEHIVLDHLCPPIAHYLPRGRIEEWFAGLDAGEVALRWHNRNSWNVVAEKR